MREILFRGKNKLNGIWVYGDLRNYEKSGAKAIFSHELLYRVEVDPKTVGQFTGLTDKNGKKIFEGDIIKIDYFNDYITGQVVYNKITCGFEFWYESVVGAYGEKALRKMNFSQFRDCEVIGNIHDNPDF